MLNFITVCPFDFDMPLGNYDLLVMLEKRYFSASFLIRSLKIFQQCKDLSFLSELFFFPTVPGVLNRYILCDETNSSSINDSKRDVAPKWVDLPFTTSMYCTETIMAGVG